MTPGGRGREIASLHALLAAGGRVVAVSGEAGAGKSTLLAAAVRDRAPVWVSFVSGRFPLPGAGLRRLAAAAPDATALRAVLDEPGTGGGAARVAAIWQAADDLLAAPGRVLVLDDVQWADDLTLGWLANAGDAVARSGAGVLLGARTGEDLPGRVDDALLPLARRGIVDRVHLAPFDTAGIAAALAACGASGDEAALAALRTRTGGLPLAVAEVVRHVARDGVVTAGDVTAVAARRAMPVLAGIVREQVAALPPDAREVVAAAALLPSPRTEAALASVCGWPPARFDAAVAAAYGSGLLVRNDDVAFRHEVHRELAAAALPLAERRARHRRIAAVLAALPGTPAADVAAQHLDGGDDAGAVEWLERAAEEANRAHDYGAAITAVRTALPIARTVDPGRLRHLSDKAVMAAQRTGRYADGVALLTVLAAAAPSPRERGWLVEGQGRLLAFAGDYEARHERLGTALREFRAAGDAHGMAHALAHLAYPVATPQPLTQCVADGREALDLARTLGDARLVGICAGSLALATLFAGGDDGPIWAEGAAALAGTDPPAEAHAARTLFSNWAATLVSRGAYREAERVLAEGRRECVGGLADAVFDAWESVLRWRTGEWDAARALADRALAGPRYAQVLVADFVVAAIGYERDRRPDPAALQGAAEAVVRQRSAAWAPIAQAELARARAARREPAPHRGLAAAVDTIAAQRLATGWEDLVATAAEVSPEECEAALRRLDGLWPVGARAAAVRLYVDGL
ncbi:MAG TPA: ATP-binding protein, partial [Frankiaceae bacterium]|nr:ATP-binding protein [Frankiaceae bacterium]